VKKSFQKSSGCTAGNGFTYFLISLYLACGAYATLKKALQPVFWVGQLLGPSPRLKNPL
jgi:hypothetical protein